MRTQFILIAVLAGLVLGGWMTPAVGLAFLEVRPTNVEALGLYESFGFRVIGRRKGYYFDTGEDAGSAQACGCGH